MSVSDFIKANCELADADMALQSELTAMKDAMRWLAVKLEHELLRPGAEKHYSSDPGYSLVELCSDDFWALPQDKRHAQTLRNVLEGEK